MCECLDEACQLTLQAILEHLEVEYFKSEKSVRFLRISRFWHYFQICNIPLLTLFNVTGLDPSTVWPLCHMRHVCKDDFRYFGSSGPLSGMTPMSHETCWQRRLSLFRIVFDQSPAPPTPSRLSSVTESANTAGKWTWVITN